MPDALFFGELKLEERPYDFTYLLNPIAIVVININKTCNLKCKYCEKEVSSNNGKMSFNTMKHILDKLAEFPQTSYNLQFFGGEPLMNFNLIKETVEYCKRIALRTGKEFKFIIQTNATLIDEEIALFLRKNKFKVGVSLDGPQFISDRIRVFPDGSGSYRHALKGIEHLRNTGILFGVICVLSKINYRFIDLIVKRFIDLGVKEFKLNIIEPFGRASITKEYLLSEDEYCESLKKLMRILVNYKGKIIEQNLKYILTKLVRSETTYMCMKAPCGAGSLMLAFDINGDVYPCDRFIGTEEWKLMNFKEFVDVPLAKVRDNIKIATLQMRSPDTINSCKECRFKYCCGFSCPAVGYRVRGSIFSTPLHCKFYKCFIPYALRMIKVDKKILDYLVK